MQKTPLKLQLLKKKGISLVVSVVVSFFVLGMTMAILISVNKAFQNAVGIERFNQATFAAEAGLEAAFFHHNARGQGVHFTDVTTVGNGQTISFPDGDIRWSILGRTDEQVNEQVLTGVLKENQTITIPLYFDFTNSVSNDPSQANSMVNERKNFRLKFNRYLFDDNGVALSGNANKIIENGFDFGLDKNLPVINWSVSRRHENGEIETFIPTSILDKGRLTCDEPSYFPSSTGYVCLNNLNNGLIVSSAGSSPIGKVLPGDVSTNLFNFINGADAHFKPNITINFRPLVSFEDTSGEKIIGIPWALEIIGSSANDDVIPKPYYEAEVVAIDQNNYQKYIKTRVMEQTAVGILDVLTLE